MKVISILAQKGGVGKSTLARHWAIVAQEQMGQSVAIIDIDPQGTVARWSQRRESETPVILHADESNLNEAVKACETNGIDLVFIDTPPSVERLSAVAAKASDVTVIPCGPTVDDIEALEPTIEIAQRAGIQSVIVINDGRPGSPINDKAKSVLRGYGMPICPKYIMHRAILADSFIDGRTVLEVSPSSKGAEEMVNSWKWLAKELQLTPKKKPRRRKK